MNADKKENLIFKIFNDVGNAAKGYTKGMIIVIIINFVILSAGLFYLRIPAFFLVAVIIALVDIIPVLGSGIIMLPWSVYLYIAGNSHLAVRIAVLYLFLIIIRQILEPVIIGRQIGLKPLTTFLSAIAAVILMGPLGVIIGPVLAVVINTMITHYKKQ